MANLMDERKWFHIPHISRWLALCSVLVGTTAVSCCVFPYVTILDTAAQYYSGISFAAIQWLTYIVSAVAVPIVVLVSPVIRKFGIHVVVYASASCLLLGAILRCFSIIPSVDSEDETRSALSFGIVLAGTAVMALALGPFQVAGTLVSTTFPSEGRLLVHGMVCSATPLGMLLGTLVPRLVDVVPGHAKPGNMDALLLVHTAIAAAAFIATVHLMRTATNSLQAPAKGTRQETSGTNGTTASAANEHEARGDGDITPRDTDSDGGTAAGATDFLPQIAKLAHTAEYLCFAAAFAACVAPFYLLFGAQDLLLPVVCAPLATGRMSGDGGFWGSPASASIVSATIILLLLIPCILHFIFLRRQVRPVSILLPGLALLALTVVWANIVSESGGMRATEATPHALLAGMALFATALMPMLLESSISAVHRDRPALAAGAVWLATHLLVVACAAILQALRVSNDACPPPLSAADNSAADASGNLVLAETGLQTERARTLDRVKWLCVVSVGLASVAAVSSLLLSTRIEKRAYGNAQKPKDGQAKSFQTLYMNSNQRDALHPDNLPRSFVRPVWWQNPTAEMQRGLKEALEDLQAAAQDDTAAPAHHADAGTQGSPASSASPHAADKADLSMPEAQALGGTRTGPGGVPRPVRVAVPRGSQRQGIGSMGSSDVPTTASAAALRSGRREQASERQRSRSGRHSSIWGSRNSSWDSPSERPSTRGTPRAKSTASAQGAVASEASNV